MVVFDPSREQVHYLNSTAAVVFEFCDGTHTARNIADNAAALFPESDEDWTQVVIECLTDLRRLHLII